MSGLEDVAEQDIIVHLFVHCVYSPSQGILFTQALLITNSEDGLAR